MKQVPASRFMANLTTWLRAVRCLGWPRQLALALLALGSICLVSAWQLERQAQDLRTQLEMLQKSQGARVDTPPPALETLSIAPEDSQYIKDLELLFQIAGEVGVGLGSIDYKSEVNAKVPVALRTLDLRVREDYPKIKGFISKVLFQMPNAALQEIRIERKDAQTMQSSMLIKLTLVYQLPSKNAAGN